MNVRDVCRELELIGREMSGIIIDTNFCQVGSSVTWGKYKTGIASGVNYLSQYRKVIDDRQYSFLLSGGHALQIYYEWHGNDLIAAKQAIYPAPYVIDGWEDEWPDFELSEAELLQDPDPESEAGLDMVRASCWSHIRFDFDLSAESHDIAHIQNSSINEFRVPSTIVVPPFMFMVMAVRLLHPAYYETVRERGWFLEAVARAKRQCVKVAVLDTSYPFLSIECQ
ncbi:DUF2290 domain-containing protein [Azospirillum argentinense]|uniref:DUF2290 domain-containing protein n=1 Tax=Azospirillum argentinense TaxID=2970906 RepID=UPI001186358E|nr:DUF2290 domain-containing protein [Azospirillum argentinense]